MDLKAKVMALLDPSEVWAEMFEGWKPGKNVSCPVAAETHESGADKTPSMSLSEDGKAYCHACEYWATTPIGVLADMEGLELAEACKAAYERFVAPLVPELYVKSCHEALLRDEYILAVLEERRRIALPTVKRFELGWDAKKKRLVIPVRNEMGWCVNTRLHDTTGVHPPEMKIVSYGKGYGSAQLWPHWQLAKPGPVYLFEGEMDALAAHSQGLPSMSVTGGSTTWREEWSRALIGRKVYVVPDKDKAGAKGAAKKAESLSRHCEAVKVLELPGLKGGKDDKDFTDWLKNHEGTGKALQALAGKAKEQPKGEKPASDDSVLDVFAELSNEESKDIKRGQAAWQWLKQRGAFFKNQSFELYYAMDGGRAYRVGHKAEAFVSMMGADISWAINPATRSGKFVIGHVVSRGMTEAKDSITGSWCLYDEAGDIYLYCGQDKLLRARAGKLEVVKNALNERGVLLECPPQIQTFDPVLDADPVKAVKALWANVFDLLPISQADKLLVMCWWLGGFFKEYVRPKPLIRFMARTAYGKSTTTKMLSLLTYGEEVLQSCATTPAALYSISRQFPFVFADNVETRNMTGPFEDFLLTAATGGGKTKRQLHTDTGIVWEGVNCLVATNGIEPVNKREIVSRTVEVALDLSKYGRKDFHETKVFDAIRKSRPEVICGLLRLLTDKAVPRIRAGEVQRIAKELGQHAKNRFDEYLGIMAVCLDAVWPHVKTEYKDPKDVVATWLKLQTEATDEQDEGTNEVLYFLQELAERGKSIADVRTRPETLKDGSVKISATMRELFTDMRVMARALNTKCPWQNERQLGTRVADAYSILVKAGWTHQTRLLAGRRINDFTKRPAGEAAKAPAVRGVAPGKVPGQGVRDVDLNPRKKAAGVDAVLRLRWKDTVGKA